MTVTLGARPADDPIWATDGLNTTEPIEAKKELGWELGEEPPSAYFNWWQNNVYLWQQWLEAGVDALNAGKVDVDGDTMTGLLSANGGIAVLNANLELSGTSVLSMQTGANNVAGGLAPISNGLQALGLNAWRWDAYIDHLYATRLAATMVADGVAGVSLVDVDIGSEQLPIFRVVANQIVAKHIGVLSAAQPGSNADLAQLNQLTMVLARGKITSTGAPTISNNGAYNRAEHGGDRAVRVGAGNFYVDLLQAVPDDATAIATPSDPGALDYHAQCAIVSSGTRVQITLRNSAGTLVDGTVSYLVVGYPRTLVTDSILAN